MSSQPDEPPLPSGVQMFVDVPVGEAPAGEALGAVDAVLGGDFLELQVRLLISGDHPERATLAELCAADPRLSLASPGAEPPPAPVHLLLPPDARPSERALNAIWRLVVENGSKAIDVALPGRSRVLTRLGIASRLPGTHHAVARARGARGRVRRVSHRDINLGSSRLPPQRAPRPEAGLSAERAEHLRHRARAATNRSRMERSAQRLARERMRVQHERARAALFDRRIAAAGPRYWLSWRLRRLGASAWALVLKPWYVYKRARTAFRRARRIALDQILRRRSPAPAVKRPGQEYLSGPP